MHYDKHRRTFDCEPTLTDSQVLQFCREGHLTFPGVVPEVIVRSDVAFGQGLQHNLPVSEMYYLRKK